MSGERAVDGGLAPMRADLSPEAQQLADNLRSLFRSLNLSVTRYAARRFLDKSAVSRYLSGTRMPPWEFVHNLLHDVAEHSGNSVTPQTLGLIDGLYRQALAARGSTSDRIQLLQLRLADADRQARTGETECRALAEALTDREHRVRDVELQLRQLVLDHSGERDASESAVELWRDEKQRMCAERDALNAEVHRLRVRLRAAEQRVETAEATCRTLERQLDAVESNRRDGGHATGADDQAGADRGRPDLSSPAGNSYPRYAFAEPSDAGFLEALQLSMLPRSMPVLAGVRYVCRYVPGAVGSGGDWYDAVRLPGGRIALMVGDVIGRSGLASAVMGQMRAAVQTLAGFDLPPHEILYRLDEQVRMLGHEALATCVLAVYDPSAHRMVLSNAGHLPPLLLLPSGHVRLLDTPNGVPIGVGEVPFESLSVEAPPGSTLVLYTDGLVQSRDLPVDTGLELLRAALADSATVAPDEAPGRAARAGTPDRAGSVDAPGRVPRDTPADRATRDPAYLARLEARLLATQPAGLVDDGTAFVLACLDGIPASHMRSRELDVSPLSPAGARHFAVGALRRWGLSELIDVAELLVSELVTNAVRHADHALSIRLWLADALVCEVRDDGAGSPYARLPDPLDETGRGLFLVSKLARAWGVTRLGKGKVVWFELALPRHATPPRV
ncbi:ATP-binding SpoIIE family protein phosphatase [Streptomyces zagrosensis]|uniref:Serine phosphatase RsbU (Regulator of sigma subunit)/anti-sigma regulatory factor (Ser/Thr protein kinase) n=1 Tax=Streptomyces zagrosensis TaxID=1042984 RepID=A0A7W9Q881_9ACTN|nr:SpoIIE family protein phosphatase [Streptomyces zagrosensis]MBB5935395.1 serine phosphatase RsbU (regulator of sigma subunit)/anti-sigma regulatory factor (Ser/Thr protein kinase) [Streptomyces zagrosensis]